MNQHRNPNPNNVVYRQAYSPPLPPPRAGQLTATAAAARFALPFPGPLNRAIASAHTVHAQIAPTAAIAAAAVAAGPGPIQAAASSADDKVPAATAVFVPSTINKPNTHTTTTKTKYKKRTKKYNNFNIFFMLERQLLLQSRGGGINATEKPIDTSNSPMVKHMQLRLPPLCRRYNHLPLTSNWFLELLVNQKKKRPHRKSHGLIPFKELAQTVAKNYREIDDETQSFVNEVAERLGWHCEEMEVLEEKERQEEKRLLADGQLETRAAISRAKSLPKGDQIDGMTRNVARMAGSKVGFSVLGASVYASKKRKDAPVVSVAGRAALVAPGAGLKQPSLLNDEASTVQQLMGMKSLSPPQGHLAVTESDRLQMELSQAMNSRLESERRIHYIQEQMSMHHASRAAQSHSGAHNYPAATLHHGQVAAHPRSTPQSMLSPGTLRQFPAGYEQYLSLLTSASHQTSGSDSARGVAPTSMANTADNKRRFFHPDVNSLDNVERELLKEAVLRRLIPTVATNAGGGLTQPTMGTLEPLGYPNNAMRGLSTGRCPMGAPQDHPLQGCEAAKSVPLKKRAKYSETVEGESKNERADGILNNEPYPPNTASATSDTTENQSLYSKLATSAPVRDTDAKRDHPLTEDEASQQRDLALMDRLLARSSGVDPATVHHALMDSSAGGGYPPRDASYHYSPTHLTAGHHPPHHHNAGQSSYAALLSQLAATQHSTAAGGAARHHHRSPIASPIVNLTPHPVVNAASQSAPECVNASVPGGRGVSASPTKQNPSLFEIVNAASSNKSLFGLTYNDIMDVWRDMNPENTADHSGGRPIAGEGNNHGDHVDKSTKKEAMD